ncbi:MAG: polysaccharide pyruvyl transferase family protein, partial [Chthoniobacterales bacterium]|nr:polysaccharide pyruvyl transferase family protein [Chthoniobacterales bacterium]
LVFVRETLTKEYLVSCGVSENVRLVADPAFLMEPLPVAAAKLGFDMPEGAMGLNFSPLIARYVSSCGGEAWNIPKEALDRWIDLCAELVARVRNLEKRPIVLVPHVMHESRSIDDASFLAAVARKVGAGGGEIRTVPGRLNAQELKWVIGKCHVFAGARTHSTIAALSSLVPTLSIGYSTKALGINRDIFGHMDFVEDSSKFDIDSFTDKFTRLLARRDEVHEILRSRIPDVCESSHMAGTYLRNLVENKARRR